MKLLPTIVMLAMMAGCSSSVPTEKLYRVRPITQPTDTSECAKDGGKAFMVADIDARGYIVSEWAAGCILELK